MIGSQKKTGQPKKNSSIYSWVTVPLPNAPILFDLFGKVVPPQFFDELRERLGLQAQGIYTLAVVGWVMMWQRLGGGGNLSMGGEQGGEGGVRGMLPPGKRGGGGGGAGKPRGPCPGRERVALEAG